MSLFTGQNRDAEVENGFMDTVGEWEGGMNWEGSPETYITTCKIASQKFLCYVTQGV